MATFRNKNRKTSKKKQEIATLDMKHQEKVEYFENKINSLPGQHRILQHMTDELQKLEEKPSESYTPEDIHQKAILKDKIEDLELEINRVENNLEMMEYYSQTHQIFDEYYSKDLDQDEPRERAENILELFERSSKTKKKKSKKSSKADLFEAYNAVVNPEYVGTLKTYEDDRCDDCGVDFVLNHTEACLTCPNCQKTEFVLMESERPNYKDPIPDNSAYAYKRINHLNELLSQFQAKESTAIPNDVYDQIIVEINKTKIKNNLADLTPSKMRNILKKLGLHKYYEHIPHMINKLNGLPPPNMSREVEEKIRQMFKEIQEPFALYCPRNRRNFLSYNYVLHKFCELLELDQFLPCFPLLKSVEKLQLQDRIWKQICNHLRWEFIASI